MSQYSPTGSPSELMSMGEPIARYMTENKFLSGLKILGGSIGLAVAQLAILYFLEVYYPIFAIATVLGVVIGFFMTIFGLFTVRRKLFIYKDGLAEVSGRKTTSMRWDDIAWLKERVTVQRGDRGSAGKMNFFYTIGSKDGTQLVLKEYDQMDAMGTTIFGEVNRRLEPKYTDAYERGEAVKFGDIAISKNGIDFGKGPIAWGEIEELTTAMGKLAVRRSGQRLDVSNSVVSEIPNFSLLSRMLKPIMEETAGKSS